MMSYSSPELIDAEVRYRRERLAGDWRSTGWRDAAPAWRAHRAWATVAALGRLGTTSRRHRHA